MAETAASTAYGPMFIVAMEQYFPEAQQMLKDQLAEQMLVAYMKVMLKPCKIGFLRRGLANLLEKATPGVYGGIICRKRFVEDKLLESLDTGIDSIVLLGAGLDTLAYRIPQAAKLKIYELDLPENSAYKKQRLEALYGNIPANVSLLPIDFESQKLEDVLVSAGYSFDQKSYFVWEGVTQYINEGAVRDTFQFLAKAKSGSRLVFTYVLKDFIDGKNTYDAQGLYERFRVKSQVWQLGLAPDQISRLLAEYGWTLLEDAGAKEFIERYEKPTGRTQAILSIERSAYAEKS